MHTHRKNNLKINSQNLGPIFVEPQLANPADIESAKIVIFPAPIRTEWMKAVVEWAAGTQVPFFCHVSELSKLKREGFGAYRFQKLDAFKEVDFLAGSIEFFPSRPKKEKNFKGWFQDLKEVLGIKSIPGFHLVIKGKKEAQVVFLAHPFIDHIEWSLLNKGKPLAVVGSSLYSHLEWQKLAQKFRTSIFHADDIEIIDTVEKTITFREGVENEHFNVISQKSASKTLEADSLA